MKLKKCFGDHARFHCPGCDEEHVITVSGPNHPRWDWNGSTEAPTLRPSIRARSGHYVEGFAGGECWCTYNAAHAADPAPFHCRVCHSFVTDGRIEFLGDCTHALAGQTVDLPDLEAA
jgi:hypothetical protein